MQNKTKNKQKHKGLCKTLLIHCVRDFNLSTPWDYCSKTIFQFVKDKMNYALISLFCPITLPAGTEHNFKIRVLYKSNSEQLLASSEFNETFHLRNKLTDNLGSCLMKRLSVEALDSDSLFIIYAE